MSLLVRVGDDESTNKLISILKTETPPVTCAQSTLLLSPRLIWAAFSRGSGFVL